MSAMLLSFLLPMVARLGLPLLEKRFPKLAPLLEELLKVVGGSQPTTPLHMAANHYEELSGAPEDLKS